jgi:hypothetical protein
MRAPRINMKRERSAIRTRVVLTLGMNSFSAARGDYLARRGDETARVNEGVAASVRDFQLRSGCE